jgi:hypothetical protein
VFGQAVVQTCIIHLIRNTFRHASKKYWARSRSTSSRSTGPPRGKRCGRRSRNSTRNGPSPIRRSGSCGATLGAVRGVSRLRSLSHNRMRPSLAVGIAGEGVRRPARPRATDLPATPAERAGCVIRRSAACGSGPEGAFGRISLRPGPLLGEPS